jgi:inhibitor of KinA sporulation pathway (predicted exonuclease)
LAREPVRRSALDTVNVVDVEATCWEGAPPAGQRQEIIEIGLCALRVADGALIEHTSLLVRPTHSTVSPFCTALTTLTQEQVDQGIPFAQACDTFRTRFHSRDRVLASYGDFDRRLFESQCQSSSVPYPFGRRHLNVKTLFPLVHALPAEIGMAEALHRLHLPLEGTHHRAGDDAQNIARILAALLIGVRQRLSTPSL